MLELLNRGIDPNIRTYQKETAAKIARQYGHEGSSHRTRPSLTAETAADIAKVVTAAVHAKIDTQDTIAAALVSVANNSPSPRSLECSSFSVIGSQTGEAAAVDSPPAALSRKTSAELPRHSTELPDML